MEFKTVTSEDMLNVGKKIGSMLHGGEIILLYGELGSGKSTLAKGIAEELGAPDSASSPTFTLMNVYEVNKGAIKKIIHADTYRLKDEQDLADIGIDEYMCSEDAVCIFEWPDKVEGLLKDKKTVKVDIEYIDQDRRKITVTGI